jgi:hypothetical protein
MPGYKKIFEFQYVAGNDQKYSQGTAIDEHSPNVNLMFSQKDYKETYYFSMTLLFMYFLLFRWENT